MKVFLWTTIFSRGVIRTTIFSCGVISLIFCPQTSSSAISSTVNWIRRPENAHVKEGNDVVLNCSLEYFKSGVEPSWLKMTEDGFPEYKSIGKITFDESCSVTGDSTIGEYNMLIHKANVDRHGGKWRCTYITADPQYWEITLNVQSSISQTTRSYNKKTVPSFAVDSSGPSLTTTRNRDDSNVANQEPPAGRSQKERYSSSAEQEKVMSLYVITIPYMIAISMILDPA